MRNFRTTSKNNFVTGKIVSKVKSKVNDGVDITFKKVILTINPEYMSSMITGFTQIYEGNYVLGILRISSLIPIIGIKLVKKIVYFLYEK